ncbi:MAG: FHA domain-containing protein [Bdellovibrionales bacterium]|nr:FHA domain-containing protein [Bdellovibrionales bacterium]
MENDKNTDFQEEFGQDDEYGSDTSSRARNRTVMLTPEITGEVRARLAKDMSQGKGEPAQGDPFAVPERDDEGFVSPTPSRSSYQPAMSSQAPVVTSSVSSSAPSVQRNENEYVVWSKKAPVAGFLVSYDSDPNGSVFELRSGRLIVTSEVPGAGNFLVVRDETVSPMHAIMRVANGGEIQILDQLSEFGTRIIRYGSGDEEELSGDKSTVEHGDVVMFGERRFHVCLVIRGEAGSPAQEGEE